MNLREKSNVLVDWESELKAINDWKPEGAHAATFAEKHTGYATNPISAAMKSRKMDRALTGIKDRIQRAAREQLEPRKPGLVVCFLETITERDFPELASNSGLQKMAGYILNKREYEHLAALIFCSEEEIVRQGVVVDSSAKGLTFRNPNCVFEQAKEFPFLQ